MGSYDAARSRGADTVHAPARTRIFVRADSQARSLGEGVVDRRDPRLWSAVLERSLRATGADVEVENAGVAGLRIVDARLGYERDHLVRDCFDAADTVILALGVNDWWPLARPRAVARAMERVRPLPLRAGLHRAYQRARPSLLRWSNGRFRPTDPAEARRDLERLVGALRRRHEVALVTPLPVVSPRIPGFDGNTVEAAAAVRDVARAAGVSVVDTHELFEPVAWDEISADHVHVNPSGHEVIGQAVAEALTTRLTSPPVLEKERPSASRSPDVVVRCDLDSLMPGTDGAGRDGAAAFVSALERQLAAAGRSAATVVDGCFSGVGMDYLHRSVLHDPVVREPLAAAPVTVLGVSPPGPITPYVREAYGWLVAVTAEITRPVLLVPPFDTSGRRTRDRFARLVHSIGRAHGLRVVDWSDGGVLADVEECAAALAAVVAAESDARSGSGEPRREST